MKDAHRYAVQVSDTTMLTMAASLPGQKLYMPERKQKSHLFYEMAFLKIVII